MIVIPRTCEQALEITVSPLENDKLRIESHGDFTYMGDEAWQVIGAGIYEAQEFIMRQHLFVDHVRFFGPELGQNRPVLLPDIYLSLQPSFREKIDPPLPAAKLLFFLGTQGAV